MATENYGAYAQLVGSIAQTPVSTDTFVYFIGSCASGDLNKAYWITSMSDYAQKLGGAVGDGYNLTDAAIAAFQIAGLSGVYMIPVSHSRIFVQSHYMGNASLFTGIYALEAQMMDNPTMVNLVCAPNVITPTVLTALVGLCKKAGGHWDSFMLYDVTEEEDQINSSGVIVPSKVIEAKQLNDEQADAVWGHVKTSDGNYISGAAVRACLMAKSDASYGCPARCGGNIPVSGVQKMGLNSLISDTIESDNQQTLAPGVTSMFIKVNGQPVDYIDGYEYIIDDVSSEAGELENCVLAKGTYQDQAGKLILRFDALTELATNVVVSFYTIHSESVKITESAVTELSADGICSWINYSGQICTWGDHTSAFSGGTVADERARFDNSIRMLQMITNRFQM